MAPSTGRDRRRAQNQASIIDAALGLLEREGPAALTIRRVAGEIDYTAPVVYQHFASKDDLLLALIVLGFDQLRDVMTAAAQDATPDDRLLTVARAYLDFADRRPALYQLMNDGGVDSAERQRAAGSVIALTDRLVTEWAGANDVAVGDAMTETSELIWGTLHGMATLGRIETIGPAHAVHLAERALRTLCSAWRRDGFAVPDQP